MSQAEIPSKLARKLAGICRHCSELAVDGSSYCAPHDAMARAGLCVAGCGRKVVKRAGRKPRECSDCTKLHRKRAADARSRVRTERVACVPTSGEISPSVKLEVGRDGATRTRYVPRPGQGGPSREETDRGLLRDLQDGLGRIQSFVSDWPPPRNRIAELARVQRSEAWDQFGERPVYAIRMLAGVVHALPTSWARDRICCACGQGLPVEDR